MSYPTFGDLKTQVLDDTDNEDEEFIDSDEWITLFNEAVQRAEAIIHTLGREAIYFRSRALLSITNGSSEVALPTDIYQTKILKLIYSTSGRTFPITRLRHETMYEDLEAALSDNSASDIYQYLIKNDTGDTAPALFFVPAAKETSSTKVKCWYIRNATRMASNSTSCDIPFPTFIVKYVRWKAYFKEGHPNTPDAKQEMLEEERLMIETLQTMIPDDDSRLELDTRIYEEMS